MTAIALLAAITILMPVGFLATMFSLLAYWIRGLDESQPFDSFVESGGSISERSGIE